MSGHYRSSTLTPFDTKDPTPGGRPPKQQRDSGTGLGEVVSLARADVLRAPITAKAGVGSQLATALLPSAVGG